MIVHIFKEKIYINMFPILETVIKIKCVLSRIHFLTLSGAVGHICPTYFLLVFFIFLTPFALSIGTKVFFKLLGT